MTIVPKSGWPVLGQTAVNSGQVISISYSRSGNWFGNVSSVAIVRLLPLRLASPHPPARAGTPPARAAPPRPGRPRSIVTEAPEVRPPRDPGPRDRRGHSPSLLFAASPPRPGPGDSASRRGLADCEAGRGWTLDSSP